MEFTFESTGANGVYKLSGNLIGENDGLSITEHFEEQVGEGVGNFVMDLSSLVHINSTGLGVLVTLLTKARKKGGDLFLASPSDYISNLLMITKLNTIFQIFDSIESAQAEHNVN